MEKIEIFKHLLNSGSDISVIKFLNENFDDTVMNILRESDRHFKPEVIWIYNHPDLGDVSEETGKFLLDEFGVVLVSDNAGRFRMYHIIGTLIYCETLDWIKQKANNLLQRYQINPPVHHAVYKLRRELKDMKDEFTKTIRELNEKVTAMYDILYAMSQADKDGNINI